MTPQTMETLIALGLIGTVVFFCLWLTASWDRAAQANFLKHKVERLDRENQILFSRQFHTECCGKNFRHDRKEEPEAASPSPEKPSGFFRTLLKLGVLAAIAFIGYKLYRKYQENRKNTIGVIP